MRKFSVLITIAMMSVSMATITFLTDLELSNTTGASYNLTAVDCIIINSAILNTTNMQICGVPLVMENRIRNLTYGESITEPLVNLTVNAPPYPTINATLNGGQTYLNSTISIQCLQTKKDINQSMDFGEVFYDADTNITLSAPAFPALNINRNMSFGEIYVGDPRYNMSFMCPVAPAISPDSCRRNITTTIGFNDTYTNDFCAITVNGPGLLGIDRTLGYGEVYQRDDLGIKFTGPAACSQCQLCAQCQACPVINRAVVLDSATPKYENTEQQLTVECKQTTQLSAARSSFIAGNSSCNTSMVSLTGIDVAYCAGDITTACTPDERLSGDFEGCMNRIANDSSKEASTCRQEKVKLTNDLQVCQNGQATTKEIQSSLVELVSYLVVGAGIIFVLILYLKRKQKGD